MNCLRRPGSIKKCFRCFSSSEMSAPIPPSQPLAEKSTTALPSKSSPKMAARVPLPKVSLSETSVTDSVSRLSLSVPTPSAESPASSVTQSEPSAAGYPQLTIQEARDTLMEMVGKHIESMLPDEDGSETGHSIFKNIPKKQDGLPVRSLKDSYREVVIPLGSNPELRIHYVNFYKGIRYGRILEDLDTFAELICYTHNRRGDSPKSPLSTVTALVDRIELGKDIISASSDLKLTGNVTWVGTTSMEVTMDVYQVVNSQWQKMINARFLMVARNPVTGGPAAVNPLKPNGPEEEEIFMKGEANKAIRQNMANKSLLKTPPDESERLIIHNLFLETIDESSSTFKIRIKPENSVWMEDAGLKNVIVCHPQQRNLYNKIFGGYLMRKALELAVANAALYCKVYPKIKVVHDICFKKPVEIGSLLFLSSQIVYTEGSLIQVKVLAEVVNQTVGNPETTNNFHFTFDCGLENMPQVKPRTYAESMLYLDGKRHCKS
ncbi:hypothetical protein SNE40_001182 [Patella caerulea]|uniref:HotDog ACOT-type domain-containing protein n=2 Tax=Patella caerulea TaxID=87958 RepID=A0AAN8Q2M5_PATCE